MRRPPGIPGALSKLLFGATKLNGGAEGPGRRLQREGLAEAVPTREAARPRRDAFEALKADVGRQVQAPRPRTLGKSAAEGPNDRLQADLIDFSQNTRGKTKYGLVVMDVFTREAAVEPLQNKNAETVGRTTKRAARELTGDDGNFVVTTDLGNEFATLERELPEAVHRTKRPEDRNAIAVVDRGIQTLKKDLATRVARKGGQWSDHFEWAAGAYNARPHETAHGAPEDVEKQPATEFRVLQDNADKFQHNKDLTNRRIKAVEDAGAFRRRTRRGALTLSTAAGGRGLHDRPQHGGAGDPAEAGAAGAGQRQRGGPADETGQTGGCEAAGRLPGASEAQGPRLAFLKMNFLGTLRPLQASAFPRKLEASPFWRKKRLITRKLELLDRAKTLEKRF